MWGLRVQVGAMMRRVSVCRMKRIEGCERGVRARFVVVAVVVFESKDSSAGMGVGAIVLRSQHGAAWSF